MENYRPVLPPKAGYAEREGEYFPTDETRRILDIEKKTAEINSVVRIMFALEAESENPRLDESTILERIEYFTAWTRDYTGRCGSVVSEDGALYRALHDVGGGHLGMRPSETQTLWKRMGNPNDTPMDNTFEPGVWDREGAL